MNYAKEDFFTQTHLKTKLRIWVYTTNQLHATELLLKIYQSLSQSQNSPPFIESYSLNQRLHNNMPILCILHIYFHTTLFCFQNPSTQREKIWPCHHNKLHLSSSNTGIPQMLLKMPCCWTWWLRSREKGQRGKLTTFVKSNRHFYPTSEFRTYIY